MQIFLEWYCLCLLLLTYVYLVFNIITKETVKERVLAIICMCINAPILAFILQNWR